MVARRVGPLAGRSATEAVASGSSGFVFAGVASRTKFTRFSSAGGGHLPTFADSDYLLTQLQQGSAYHHRGFSWQQELHAKRIEDTDTDRVHRLWGGYAQVGYFLHGVASAIPPQLELAVRHAFYNPNTALPNDLQQELSFVVNWFFRGHLNKLTAEASRFAFGEEVTDREDGWRFRLQWDISM